MLKITPKVDRKLRTLRERVRREITHVGKGGSGVLAKRLKASVGDVDRKQNQRHFSTGGKSTGEAFIALKPDYARRKLRKWGRKPILTASGHLRDSLRFAKHPDRIERSERSPRTGGLRLVLGTRVPWALHLHRGKAPLAGPRPAIRKTTRQIKALKETMLREVLRRIDEVSEGKLLSNRAHRVPAAALGREIHGGPS